VLSELYERLEKKEEEKKNYKLVKVREKRFRDFQRVWRIQIQDNILLKMVMM